MRPGAIVFVLSILLATACKEKANSPTQSARLKILTADTGRINGYIEKAFAFVATKPDSADFYYRLAYTESQKLQFNDGIVIAILGITNRQFESGNYDSCEYYYAIAEKHALQPDFQKRLYMGLMMNAGTFYYLKGDIVNADRCFYKGLEHARKQGMDSSEMAMNLLYNLSYSKADLGQPAEALHYLDRAREIGITLKHENFLKSIAVARAAIYLDLAKTDSAKLAIQDLFDERDSSDIEYAKVISAIHINSGEPEKALPFIYRAAHASKNANIVFFEEAMNILLGKAYLGMGRNSEARTILSASLQRCIANQSHDNIIDCYAALIDAEKKMGNYKQAVELQSSLYAFKDSVLGERKRSEINELSVQYQTAQKDRALAENKLLLQEKNTQLFRQRAYAVVITLAAVLLAVVLIFVRKSIRRKSRLQKQEAELMALRSKMEGEEKERERISMELHDGIGAQLSAAMMQLRSMQPANKELSSVIRIIDSTASDVRKTAGNLMPDILVREGLSVALQDHIRNQEGTQINFQSYGDLDNLDLQLQLFIYRIVQELLHNINKHSGADKVLVQVTHTDELIAITVEDNGKGFDPNIIYNGKGLVNIKKRVEQFGGSFSIESEKDKGTTAYIEFESKTFIHD